MANTATALTELPIGVGGQHKVKPYAITIDTVNTDLIILSPASGFFVPVVGMEMCETSGGNLTFKSGSTTLVTYELAPHQGIMHPIGQGVILAAAPGEALKMQSSVAISSMLLYVLETTWLEF